MAAAERELKSLGCCKSNLQVHVYNEAAARFWESMGYRREARINLGKDLAGEAANGEVAKAPDQ